MAVRDTEEVERVQRLQFHEEHGIPAVPQPLDSRKSPR